MIIRQKIIKKIKKMKNKVIQGEITSRFGVRYHPIDGVSLAHQGIDIAAKIGTPIYSPTSGIASAVYKHHSGGLTLILRSQRGEIRYGLCHLSRVEVEVGEMVSRGDLVALSGNTGRSTGAHLHYSVKRGGAWHGEQYIGGKFLDSEPFLDLEYCQKSESGDV